MGGAADDLRVVLVETTADAQHLAQRLRQVSAFGLDCEGVQLSRHGRLCLIQVCVDQDVYLVDVIKCPAAVEALRPALESEAVTVITHDCRQDSDALFHQFSVHLRHVFDVQIADAVLKRQRWESHPSYDGTRPFREPLPISFRRLVQRECDAVLDEKKRVREGMNNDGEYWLRRPLDEDAMQYAAKDAFYLPVLYFKLSEQLNVKYRTLVRERSTAYVDEYRLNENGYAEFKERLRERRFHTGNSSPAGSSAGSSGESPRGSSGGSPKGKGKKGGNGGGGSKRHKPRYTQPRFDKWLG